MSEANKHMPRQVPRHETRSILHRYFGEYLSIAHTVYFPDQPYLRAVELMLIVDAIFQAQVNNRPFTTVAALAKHLGMKRPTLDRWIKNELARYVERDGEYLVMRPEPIGSPEAERMLDQMVQLIIDWAAALQAHRKTPDDGTRADTADYQHRDHRVGRSK